MKKKISQICFIDVSEFDHLLLLGTLKNNSMIIYKEESGK